MVYKSYTKTGFFVFFKYSASYDIQNTQTVYFYLMNEF